jgi:hypothetical protein
MIPHEKAMVDRLKDKPFALIGINSDGDRAVSQAFETKEKEALASLGNSEDAVVEQIRQGDPAFLAKVEAAAPGVVKKVKDADLANLRAILEKNGIGWRQAAQGSTRGPLPRRWNVASWPTIYVLDAKGVIRFKNLREQELEDAAVKLIAEIDKDGKR